MTDLLCCLCTFQFQIECPLSLSNPVWGADGHLNWVQRVTQTKWWSTNPPPQGKTELMNLGFYSIT